MIVGAAPDFRAQSRRRSRFRPGNCRRPQRLDVPLQPSPIGSLPESGASSCMRKRYPASDGLPRWWTAYDITPSFRDHVLPCGPDPPGGRGGVCSIVDWSRLRPRPQLSAESALLNADRSQDCRPSPDVCRSRPRMFGTPSVLTRPSGNAWERDQGMNACHEIRGPWRIRFRPAEPSGGTDRDFGISHSFKGIHSVPSVFRQPPFLR